MFRVFAHVDRIAFYRCLVAVFPLTCAFLAFGQDAGRVIGYIGSVSGGDIRIHRDAGAPIIVRRRTEVHEGDQLEVQSAGASAIIRFSDGSSENIGPVSGWYGPYEERGTEASILSNLLAAVAGTVADIRMREVKTVATAARGDDQPLQLGAMYREYPLLLSAGSRPLYLRWSGGAAPYAVTLARIGDMSTLINVDSIEQQNLTTVPVNLLEGTFVVQLSDSESEIEFAFEVVAESEVPRRVEFRDLSDPVNTYLSAYVLAAIEGNRWVFEAFQRLAMVADVGYRPARQLMDDLENGVARYWEAPSLNPGPDDRIDNRPSNPNAAATPDSDSGQSRIDTVKLIDWRHPYYWAPSIPVGNWL